MWKDNAPQIFTLCVVLLGVFHALVWTKWILQVYWCISVTLFLWNFCLVTFYFELSNLHDRGSLLWNCWNQAMEMANCWKTLAQQWAQIRLVKQWPKIIVGMLCNNGNWDQCWNIVAQHWPWMRVQHVVHDVTWKTPLECSKRTPPQSCLNVNQ